MVWEAFQLHSLCQGPHHTPGKERYSSTVEHNSGAHCWQLDVLTQVSSGKICEQGIVLETKSLGGGGGDGGCTPVSDPIKGGGGEYQGLKRDPC